MKRFRYDRNTVTRDTIIVVREGREDEASYNLEDIYEVFDGPVVLCTTADAATAEWIVGALEQHAKGGVGSRG